MFQVNPDSHSIMRVLPDFPGAVCSTYSNQQSRHILKIKKYSISTQNIRYRQIFSGGVSDQNENLVGRK